MKRFIFIAFAALTLASCATADISSHIDFILMLYKIP